ncbi:MAG: hypothetical protein ACYDIC_03230 [Desulfobaccales bacterium]
MGKMAVGMLLTFLFLTAFGITATAAAAELKLPLKLGLYLPAGVECPKQGEKPDPFSIARYQPGGLQTPGHSGCKIIQVTNEGNVYHLKQQCIVRGEDRLKITQTIIIKSNTSFALLNSDWVQKRTGKKEIVYHYCGSLDNP